jgi:uncharacterized membrane protein
MRRPYIDWLRGVAVVIMILAHTMDAWTMIVDRASRIYIWQVRVAGMAAPLFLFLAGVAVAFSAAAKARKGGDAVAAAAVRRRGWQVWLFALLFRLQSYLLSPGATLQGILKVDILNIMGPAMVGAATVWGMAKSPARRVLSLAVGATAFSLLAPIVRGASWVGVLPDPVGWYIRPPAGRSWFTLFPWAGLLFAGAAVGVHIDQARDRASERRLVARLTGGGLALFCVAYAGSFLPSIYEHSSFWTTSPSYFFIRVGLMTAFIGLAYLWMQRPSATRWSPMMVFGRHSLFVYFIHVEMAYGIVSYPLHKRLPLPWAFTAFAIFTAMMLGAAVLKGHVDASRRRPLPS